MLEYLIKKPPVTMKWPTVRLIKDKSCTALLHMLLLCIYGYLKSVFYFKFLILDIYDLDTLYLHEQGCEDLWLFFKAKRSVSKKSWGNTDIVDK